MSSLESTGAVRGRTFHGLCKESTVGKILESSSFKLIIPPPKVRKPVETDMGASLGSLLSDAPITQETKTEYGGKVTYYCCNCLLP